MSDTSDRMVEYAWISYENYMKINPDKGCDFESFSIGYFLGALAASGKRKDFTHNSTQEETDT